MKKSKNKEKCSIFSFGNSLKSKPENVDPVLRASMKKKKQKEVPPVPSTLSRAKPSFTVRKDLKAHCLGNEPVLTYGEPRIPYDIPKYIPPKTKKYVKSRTEARRKYIEDLNFCKHDKEGTTLPNKPAKEKILQITIPSPEQSEAKVQPRDLSPTESTIVARTPNPKKLELRKPKSGIIINEKERIPDYDSFDLVYRRLPRPGFEHDIKKYRKSKHKKLESIDEERDLENELEKELEDHAGEGEGEGDDKTYTEAPTRRIGGEEDETKQLDETMPEEAAISEPEGELTKVFRKKVEQRSKSTLYTTKDLGYESEDESEIGKTNTKTETTQKFRRPSEIEKFTVPPPKIKRGTLESHSFTKLQQTTLKDFYYGTVSGTVHQGANHFPDRIRNNQGLTMPVAAYCYALLKHPSTWGEKDVDEIVESGNDMYYEAMKKFDRTKEPPKLRPEDLPRYCYLFDKKIRFKLSEPLINGIIKSEQKNVYNLTKGAQIFFSKHVAGIFMTKDVNLAIWRDKYYYMFDARPRTKDLYPDPEGTALMANFYDLDSVITVLLSRCLFGNWPYVFVAIEAFGIQNKHAAEDRESEMAIEDRAGYDVVSDTKAVLQGSFELTDECFGFSRNKQAVSMAVAGLVYSRISPPSAWFRKTVDKIMIIGNQLYLECVDNRPADPLKLEQVPAEFTMGPYHVEINIKPSMYSNFVCKKGKCMMERDLETFFKRYSLAVVEIGETTVAIWKQRGVYYCFDPYSRNGQGHKDRNGVSCVTMHVDLNSLTWMITKNFCDKETPYTINAMIVCKITRQEPELCSIPLHKTMNEINTEEMKRTTKKHGKRKAVKKFIDVSMDHDMSIEEPKMPLEEDETLVHVDSGVGSLKMSTLPPFDHHPHIKQPIIVGGGIADLDSPSLSDTQLELSGISDEEEDEEVKVDVDSYQLTLEELDGKKKEKGEGDKEKVEEKKNVPIKEIKPPPPKPVAPAATAGGDQKKPEEEEEEFYMALDKSTAITSKSLLNVVSINLSPGISGFFVRPEVLPPTNLSKRLERKKRIFYMSRRDSTILEYDAEPDITQSQELRKENNFMDLPDSSQIVRGITNMADLEGQGGDMEYISPFVCIMAAAVAKKFSLVSWSPDIVEYVLKCGQELYKASKYRYDEVSRLDIPKVSLGSTDFHIVVDYLFDTLLKENILELALRRMLFARSECGIFVTPVYSCAVFYRHHLYYLYDPYGNNEVGLSEGQENNGSACLMRFKNLRDLTQRIINNKNARESVEPVEFSRFVLSKILVTALNPPKPRPSDDDMGEDGDEDEWIDMGEEDEEKDEEENEEEEEDEGEKKDKETKSKIEVGWQWYQRIGTIRGSKSLKGRGVGEDEIKKDHFACLCACLMLLEVPLDQWDTTKIDYCLDQGANIYNHADDLYATEKRIIKNILIRKHFFDVIVKKIQILNYSQNKDMSTGIDTLFARKYSYFLIQMVGSCNVIYRDDKNHYHLFDPYAINRKGKPLKDGQAGWIRYKNLRQVKRRLKKEAGKTGGLYAFYTFEVTSIKKAPKGVIIGQALHEYEVDKPKKKGRIVKPFFEEVHWLNMDPIPWSRMVGAGPTGVQRGTPDNMWYNWDIEYNGDLYSLVGNVHQTSTTFPLESRGKQTICNLVMCIAMTRIYSFHTWSSSVVDSVLVNGDNYCRECIKDIKEENYELSMTDLKAECEIFPYSFKIEISNAVDGTMFLLRSRSYNLYKALRYFFDDHEQRFGVITVVKSIGKRQVAFGKIKELEYFMFDCEAVGAPMFVDGTAVAYALRMTTLNRLLHVLTLTLRGGEFFIFEVKIVNFQPMN